MCMYSEDIHLCHLHMHVLERVKTRMRSVNQGWGKVRRHINAHTCTSLRRL
jgi:hypothetical protein